MYHRRGSGIISDFINSWILSPIEDFVEFNPIIAIALGVVLVVAMTVFMLIVFSKHDKNKVLAFIPILNIFVLFKIGWNIILSIPYLMTIAIIVLGYLNGYKAYIFELPYEYWPEGMFIYSILMPYAVIIFIILTIAIIAKAITSIDKVEYVYDTPEDDSDDAELQPPGACLDAPLTTVERQIAQSIREKKRMGQNNFTSEEKAVLHKLAWQKEYGMSKGE